MDNNIKIKISPNTGGIPINIKEAKTVSWNSIYGDPQTNDKLKDYIEGKISEVEQQIPDITGKADKDELDKFSLTNHTHSGYSLEGHQHTGYLTSHQSLDGYSTTGHSHSGYSLEGHKHDAYSLTSHTHNYITEHQSLSGYSTTGHTHNVYSLTNHTHNYATLQYVDDKIKDIDVDIDLSEYSTTGHTHDDYYSSVGHEHSDYVKQDELSNYSDIYHSHDDYYSSIGHEHSDYATHYELDNYSDIYHTHDEYAKYDDLSNYSDIYHTHEGYLTEHQPLDNYYTKDEVNSSLSGYLPLSGGDINGNFGVDNGNINVYNYNKVRFGSTRQWEIYQKATGSAGNTQSFIINSTVSNKSLYIQQGDSNITAKFNVGGSTDKQSDFYGKLNYNDKEVATHEYVDNKVPTFTYDEATKTLNITMG